MKEGKENSNFIIGTIGALLGALVGSVPWILMYVYGNMIYAFLAIIIAICSLKGYEIFKGKVDKKLPFIIAITSLLAITVSTLIIIPCLLILKEGITLSIDNFKYLYSNEAFFEAITKDYVISIIFTLLGIFGILQSIRNQIKLGFDKIDLKYKPEMIASEKLEEVKNVFTNHNALDKNKTISKDILLNEANINETELGYLLRQGIIKVKNHDYYYNTKYNNKKLKTTWVIVTCICVIIIIFVLIFGVGRNDDNKEEKDVINKNVTFTISSKYKEYIDDEVVDGEGWYYLPLDDLSGNSGVIIVSTFEGSLGDDYKALKEELDGYAEESGTILKSSSYYNKNNYYIIEYIMDYEDGETSIYYIIDKDKYGIVEGLVYSDDIDVEKDAKTIADTFKWK